MPQDTIKVRPAYSGRHGRGGAIISLLKDVRKEADINVGDTLRIERTAPGEIRLRKVV